VIAYDARTFHQTGVLNTSRDSGQAGIRQSDAGIAADSVGNVYAVTGNGKFNAASGGRDYGDSVLKLRFAANAAPVRDYFTPCNQQRGYDEHTLPPCGTNGAGSISMKHSRFKYFSKLDWAQQFLEGKMFCQTAAFFRDYEDAEARQIIGDQYEGTRLYRPVNGLEMNNVTRNYSQNLKVGMEFGTKAHEIYIFCVSLSFSEALKKEFNAVACVEICDPGEFIRRWHKALPEEAKKEGQHVSRRVGYYNPEDLPGNVWALPDLITTTKLKRFEYQDEYRFAYTTTDAFAFENGTYLVVDRKARPLPKPEEHHHQTLELGNLLDICQIHKL
jgi:hypothetical protein